MSIKFRWLGYVCFEIVLPSGKILVTDPFIDFSPTAPIRCEEVSGADYITITHGHVDHTTDLGPLAQKFNSKVICSHQVAEPLAKFFDLDLANIIPVSAAANIVFSDLRIEVKKAQHPSQLAIRRTAYKLLTGKSADPGISLSELEDVVNKLRTVPVYGEMTNKMRAAGIGAGEQLSFVFQTSDNLRVYIYGAGPYEHLRQEVMQAHPNVLFVQVGSVSAEDAAEIAALSGAEIVIPIHHDGYGVEVMHARAQELAKQLATRSTARVVDIDHGRWYEVGAKISTI